MIFRATCYQELDGGEFGDVASERRQDNRWASVISAFIERVHDDDAGTDRSCERAKRVNDELLDLVRDAGISYVGFVLHHTRNLVFEWRAEDAELVCDRGEDETGVATRWVVAGAEEARTQNTALPTLLSNRIRYRGLPCTSRSIDPEYKGLLSRFHWRARSMTLVLDTDPTKDLVEDICSRSFKTSGAIFVSVECGMESVWRVYLCDTSTISQIGCKVPPYLSQRLPHSSAEICEQRDNDR
jgi:hypothetical protein